MLALAEYEMSLCPGCGGDMDETHSARDHTEYKVDPPHRCQKCTAIGHASDAYHAAHEAFKTGSSHMHALRWRATRREGTPWATGLSASG
jgi:hypothetical protein